MRKKDNSTTVPGKVSKSANLPRTYQLATKNTSNASRTTRAIFMNQGSQEASTQKAIEKKEEKETDRKESR